MIRAIRPTSKASLKIQCLMIGKTVDEANKLYDYFAKDMPDLPDFDPVPPTWHQYLTPQEAEQIVAKMNPTAPWKRDAWQAAMTKLGLPMEEHPFYNSCALWTEMNKQYSDHAESLALRVWNKPLDAIPAEEIVPVIYAFALDVLKDKDGVYNIRSYFGL